MKTTQAWVWLTAGVIALGLNGIYQDGGARRAPRFVEQAFYRAATVVEPLFGGVEQALADAQMVAARSQTTNCSLNEALARLQATAAHSHAGIARVKALSARQEAQCARFEANRARIEAAVARAQISLMDLPVGFDTPQIHVTCPRVHVITPRLPMIKPGRIAGSGTGPI